MRTSKLILALCLIGNLLYAQTESGNFLIGSSLGFSTSSSTVKVTSGESTTTGQGTEAQQFNIAPKVGYFIQENLAVGIGIDYTLNRVKEPENVLDENTDFNISYDSDLLFGPFGRAYLPIGDDKAFFLETSIGFGSSRNEIDIEGDNQVTTNNVLALGFGPGFTIFSGDNFGIEALVKYNWARSNSSINFQGINNETTNKTNALDFSVGFQYYFARAGARSNAQTAPEGETYDVDQGRRSINRNSFY